MKNLIPIMVLSLVAGCTTVSPKQFASNPSSVSNASLCMTIRDSKDQNFRLKLANEAYARGLDGESCRKAIADQNRQVMAAIAVTAAVAGTVAYCSNHDCGSSGGGYSDYPGPCYRPTDIARDGTICGQRSAMSRPGGY